MHIRFRRVFLGLVLVASVGKAQTTFEPFEERPPVTTNGQVVAWNAAIGGVTSAIRAALAGHSIQKSFLVGVAGGAVHGWGKVLGTRSAFPAAIGGLMVSSLGTSVVVNAGRDSSPLSEVFVPVGIARVRIAPRAVKPVRLSLDIRATAALAHALGRGGLVLDWSHTARTGTPVFRTQLRRIVVDGDAVQGVAISTVVLVSDFAEDYAATLRHEMVHVQQYLFVQEAIGKPLEDYLRARLDRKGRVPRWLDFGLGAFVVYGTDELIGRRDGPYRRYIESEAEALKR